MKSVQLGQAAGLLLVLGVTACGGSTDAQLAGPQTPVESHASAAASPTIVSSYSSPPQAGVPPASAGGSTPASPAAGRPTPAPDLPSCGPAPVATNDGVRLSLAFPSPVTSTSKGVARLTNGGDIPVTVGEDVVSAVALIGDHVVSTGGSNSAGAAQTTVAPGETVELPAGLFLYDCSRDYETRIPAGSYDVVATVFLGDGRRVTSSRVNITYDP